MKVLLLSIALLIGCSEKECVPHYQEEKEIFEFEHYSISHQCGLFLTRDKERPDLEPMRSNKILSDEECDVKFRTLNSWYHRFEKDNC
jgi:hypothetical protein